MTDQVAGSVIVRARACIAARWIDAAIVGAITLLVGVVSGSQRWSGWSPPDSSFYLSLGIFGDQVTDRAIDDSYFWTRLGSIAPTRVLTELLGVWPGLFAYRLLLIGLLVTGSYVALRRFTGRTSATYLTVAWALSTVVLSFLGNPYLTGAALAGTTALIATAMYSSPRAALIAGVLLGWLTMSNPSAFLLAVTVWLVAVIQRGFRWRTLILAAVGGAVSVIVLLVAGRVMFPGLAWLSTVVESNAKLSYADFADPGELWLGDVSLLVPVLATVGCVVVWWRHRSDAAAQVGLAVSVASVNFMLVFSPILAGFPLEAPPYEALLWPPTLLGFALALTAVLPRKQWPPAALVMGATTIVAILVTGRLALGLSPRVSLVVVAGAVCALIAALGGVSRSTVVAIIAVGAVLSCAQLVQNSREQRGFFYHLTPYVWAFEPNVLSDRAHTAVNVEQWLLDSTSATDRVSTWVQGDWFAGDRELYDVAAMQLWGPNRVAMTATLTAEDIARLEVDRPSVIAMYGRSMTGVAEFWSSIPSHTAPSPPECYDFPWAAYPDSVAPTAEGHACLTRLTWD